MGWNRLKLVLAAALVCANLFLLYMIQRQARASEYIPDEAVRQITALLQKDGISFAEEALQTKKQSLVICSGDMGDSYYADTAAALCGSDVSLSFTTPSGVVFTMSDGDRCAFEGGFRLRYEAAGCSDVLGKAGFDSFDPEASASFAALNALSSREERDLHTAVRTFLTSAGGGSADAQYEISYEMRGCGTDPETGVQYYVGAQVVRDTAIPNLCSVFAVLDGEVIGMKGEWCFSKIHTTYSAQLYDQINILYKVKNRITEDSTAAHTVVTSISLAYAVYYHANSDLFYLVPAWNVTTDAGITYVLNAVNGAIYTE